MVRSPWLWRASGDAFQALVEPAWPFSTAAKHFSHPQDFSSLCRKLAPPFVHWSKAARAMPLATLGSVEVTLIRNRLGEL
jgi:hypothetical protein